MAERPSREAGGEQSGKTKKGTIPLGIRYLETLSSNPLGMVSDLIQDRVAIFKINNFPKHS